MYQMNTWHSTRVAIRCMLVAAALSLAAVPARAWNVYNYTSHTVHAIVWVNGNRTWEEDIAPGQREGCNEGNTSCNPSGSPTALVWVEIGTPNNNRLDYVAVLRMEAGGHASIYERARPWGLPPALFAETYNDGGGVRDRSDYPEDNANRDVCFLVSADCQYDNEDGQHGSGSEEANLINAAMVTRVDTNRRIRGVVYAGDLTQNTRPLDEFDWYMASLQGKARHVFDGLGNHDEYEPDAGQWLACTVEAPACVDPDRISWEIAHRKRTTVKTNYSDPHYSWDWHDVHFVQLNLFPSDSTAPDFPELSPHGSLSFLRSDLATYVGNSGRPVVLFHHYGFDEFSINTGSSCDSSGSAETWWTHDQRVAYWNALAAYNVIAIFTGHQHLSHALGCAWRTDWSRPAGGVGGPSYIPTFTSGAARNDVYLDVHISNWGMFVGRMDHSGAEREYEEIPLGCDVYVNLDAAQGGNGNPWLPYRQVGWAVTELRQLDPSCGSSATINIAGGHYPETFRAFQPATLRTTGGTVRIGP